MLKTALLLIFAIVSAWAACNYEIKNIKLDPCGKNPKLLTLTGIGAEFTDSCDVLIKGCAKIHEPLSDVKVDYKATKNGLEIIKGTKEVCEMTLFDTKFECPLAKDKQICTTEKWVQKLPKGMINMAVGNIKGDAKVKSSLGELCYKLSADIKRK